MTTPEFVEIISVFTDTIKIDIASTCISINRTDNFKKYGQKIEFFVYIHFDFLNLLIDAIKNNEKLKEIVIRYTRNINALIVLDLNPIADNKSIDTISLVDCNFIKDDDNYISLCIFIATNNTIKHLNLYSKFNLISFFLNFCFRL